MNINSRTRRADARSRRGVSFLASVTSLAEARLAQAAGADIVDCKDPASGSLGALPLPLIAEIRAALPGSALSATVGDPVPDADVVAARVAATAATGVDFVKFGLLPDGSARRTLARIGTLRLPPCRLVAVLLADRGVDLDTLSFLGPAGVAGVMLDTDDKDGPPLPGVMTAEALGRFVDEAHARGLFAGLAGKLRLSHIAALKALDPDILGFRGALCSGERRVAAMDAAAAADIRRALGGPPRPSATPARDGATAPVAGRRGVRGAQHQSPPAFPLPEAGAEALPVPLPQPGRLPSGPMPAARGRRGWERMS